MVSDSNKQKHFRRYRSKFTLSTCLEPQQLRNVLWIHFFKIRLPQNPDRSSSVLAEYSARNVLFEIGKNY